MRRSHLGTNVRRRPALVAVVLAIAVGLGVAIATPAGAAEAGPAHRGATHRDTTDPGTTDRGASRTETGRISGRQAAPSQPAPSRTTPSQPAPSQPAPSQAAPSQAAAGQAPTGQAPTGRSTSGPGGTAGPGGTGPRPGGTAPRPVERGVASHPMGGVDVSSWQGDAIDWTAVASRARFAYVKATEGTGYLSRTFGSQYAGAKAHGMYVGGYAFARPDHPPAAQADYFIDHVGYRPDGRTLPPMLDIEWPYPVAGGGYASAYPCWGLSPAAMVGWIKAFVAEVKLRTGSVTMIYTAAGWWNQCTAGSAAFADQPLFAASFNYRAPRLPSGWTTWAIWQYSSRGALPGDQDVFSGDERALAALVSRPLVDRPLANRPQANRPLAGRSLFRPVRTEISRGRPSPKMWQPAADCCRLGWTPAAGRRR